MDFATIHSRRPPTVLKQKETNRLHPLLEPTKKPYLRSQVSSQKQLVGLMTGTLTMIVLPAKLRWNSTRGSPK